jgi:hypothetical protein
VSRRLASDSNNQIQSGIQTQPGFPRSDPSAHNTLSQILALEDLGSLSIMFPSGAGFPVSDFKNITGGKESRNGHKGLS